jgi:hypothetical protein
VHDALPVAAPAVAADAEIAAVGFELRDLLGGDLVDDGQRAVGGGNAVVGGGDGQIRPADFEAALAQPWKACGEVTSCTRCRSMYSSVGAPGCSWTTCASQSFSMMVRGA